MRMGKSRELGEPPRLSDVPASLFGWPAWMVATAGEAVAASFGQFERAMSDAESDSADQAPVWTTPHRLRLELGTMALRDFTSDQDRESVAALICAPFALHRATIADFAPGHSIVEALCRGGVGRVYVTDWHSAGPQMQYLSIDNYLADLNVAVDELGPPVNLIGLCQGGWMSLAYAARFPHKVRRLVLVGAPIDIAAGESMVSQSAARVPLLTFEHLVRLNGGRVRGQRALQFWESPLGANDARQLLQLPDDDSAAVEELLARFADWYRLTVDLPGTYYLEVVSWLFKENRLAKGEFVALGRRIDLSSVQHPMFLLGARDDTLVALDQLFATATRVGTPKQHIITVTEPCGHLSLFLGADTIRRGWARIAAWLSGEVLSS